MTFDLASRRRFFAEEIESIANLKTPGLVDALATIPRERFLGPGPWVVRSESDIGGPARQTPDADPRHVYHNLAIALDPARQLFNGQPALVATLIEALSLTPGARVLHVGCGAGYYTALIASVVGAKGSVTAIDVDEGLATAAAANLGEWHWVAVRRGDATSIDVGPFDAILVNTGVTHPLDAWLDALTTGGRLVLPLTATMGAMGPIGKGPVVRLSKDEDGFAARLVTFVAIYSAIGLRDEELNARLGEALRRMPLPKLTRFRRDTHERTDACWLHAGRFCLS